MRKLTVYPRLVDQTYNAILDDICEGRIEPGEYLRQEKIAETLNVSRQPVVQAMNLLKAHGFLRDSGRRGLVATTLDVKLVSDLYEIRNAIDPMAAAKAARFADKDVVARRGWEIIENNRLAVKSGSKKDMISADMAFHSFIYSIAGNELISNMMGLFWSHMRRVMGSVLDVAEDWPVRVYTEHRAIFEAVLDGDPDRAEQLSCDHVSKAKAELEQKAANRSVGENHQLGNIAS